jgi:Zn-dependent M32 family carboxypeptidase
VRCRSERRRRRQASRSTAFVQHLAKRLRESFGGHGAAWTDSNLLRNYRSVALGSIRVEADEAPILSISFYVIG